MKRSGSRASKVSTDAQDFLENSFPGIPDAKWHEILEKEETNFFILGLREEIIQKCMEMCFHSYLERQSVAFTVHCAYLAWCKVLNVYYMVRDPGDSDETKEKKSWEPDLEPEPSIVDSWGSQCIVPLESDLVAKKAEDHEKEICVTDSTICSKDSMESCSFISNLFDFGEGEYFFSPQIFSRSSVSFSMRRSILSSPLCRSLESMVKPVEGPCMNNENLHKKGEKTSKK